MNEALTDSPDNRLVEVGWEGLSDEELLQLILVTLDITALF